jgi:hypothetical protein
MVLFCRQFKVSQAFSNYNGNKWKSENSCVRNPESESRIGNSELATCTLQLATNLEPEIWQPGTL